MLWPSSYLWYHDNSSTTTRLRTFRLRHFVYRHFVYRYFVYYGLTIYKTIPHRHRCSLSKSRLYTARELMNSNPVCWLPCHCILSTHNNTMMSQLLPKNMDQGVTGESHAPKLKQLSDQRYSAIHLMLTTS